MAQKKKSARRRAVEQFLIRCLVALLIVPIRWLPLGAVRLMGLGFAAILGRLISRCQRMMEDSLVAVFGETLTARERREIRKRCVVNICKTMAELLKLQWMGERDVKEQVSIEGQEHLDAALQQGKGVILVTAHFGNWEYMGAILSVLGYPLSVVARDANDRFVANLINNARRSKGIRVLGRSDVLPAMRALKRNEILAILPDQRAAVGGVRLRFLGRPADTPKGPALYALRTGAAVVPAFAYREAGDHIHCKVFAPLVAPNTDDREADLLTFTQMINDVIGEQIRARPAQWLWLHPRWKGIEDNEARDAA